MNPLWLKRTEELRKSLNKYSREDLEVYYVSLLLDNAETDSYIRKVCENILSEEEINGDSYGVPTIEDIVDKLIGRIKNGN